MKCLFKKKKLDIFNICPLVISKTPKMLKISWDMLEVAWKGLMVLRTA